MLKKEDKQPSSGGVICFFCKKDISQAKTYYEIRKCVDKPENHYYDLYEKSNILFGKKNILFHVECWKDFAGEELCFEK